jgi:hypothetical protein
MANWKKTALKLLGCAAALVLVHVAAQALFGLIEALLYPSEPLAALDSFTIKNEFFRTLWSIALGIGGGFAVWVAWRRVRAMDTTAEAAHTTAEAAQHSAVTANETAQAALKQATTAEQGHFTERFTRAINQLGASKEDDRPNLEIRLGAIYALERLAKDSPRDHWTIMEVLTAYVRENAPWTDDDEIKKGLSTNIEYHLSRPRTDIQAALTVIGRRERSEELEGPNYLDLSRTDLRGANLDGAHLEGANLAQAQLGNAYLSDAHLEGARLEYAGLEAAFLMDCHLGDATLKGAQLNQALLGGAHLQRAELIEASLQSANLERADLFGATLGAANLRDARLKRTNLENATLLAANLRGANLSSAIGLTQHQISVARGDSSTILPEGLTHVEGWPEKPEEPTPG